MLSKEEKDYLNKLKCPECKCGLDGHKLRSENIFDFYCVFNPDHYYGSIRFSDPIIMLREIFHIIENGKEYKIRKVNFQNPSSFVMNIFIFNVNGEGKYIEGSTDQNVSFFDDLLDFRELDGQQILDRIKLMLVFQ